MSCISALMFKKALLKSPVRPELVEGFLVPLIDRDLIRSWFDKLTTNGLNLHLLTLFQGQEYESIRLRHA